MLNIKSCFVVMSHSCIQIPVALFFCSIGKWKYSLKPHIFVNFYEQHLFIEEHNVLHNINSCLFSISSLGTSINPSTTTSDLFIVFVTFKIDTSGPKIFSATSIPSTLTGKLWIMFFLIIVFIFRNVGAYTIW